MYGVELENVLGQILREGGEDDCIDLVIISVYMSHDSPEFCELEI